jgi:hypothetical protein
MAIWLPTVLSSTAQADPIRYTFEGVADVTLDGTPFGVVEYFIEMQGDTELIVQRSAGLFDVDGEASFEIPEIANGSFNIPTRVFVNQNVSVAGFSRGNEGNDLLDLRSAAFATWPLSTPIGPIYDPAPFATSQFTDVPTSAGLLTLRAIDVTFNAVVGGGCNPCDTNCDGTVDAFDIEPFIDLLVSPTPSPCSSCAADVNQDGVVDAFDIEPFIACLVGP